MKNRKRTLWIGLAIVAINVGTLWLLLYQVSSHKQTYLKLRAENGFLFLESLALSIQNTIPISSNPEADLIVPSVKASFDHLAGYKELAFIEFSDYDRVHYHASDPSLQIKITPIAKDQALQEAILIDEPLARMDRDSALLECDWPVFHKNRFLGILRIGLTLDFVSILNRSFTTNMAILLGLVLLLDVSFLFCIRLVRRLGLAAMKLRAVLEEIEDGVLVREKGVSLFVNDRFKELCGQDWRSFADGLPNGMTRQRKGNRQILILNSELSFGRCIVVRDVTLNDIAEQSRERERRMLSMGELSSAFAHEVRNPLNAISMLVQTLGTGPNLSPQKIDLIRGEIERLNQIVKNFIQASKLPVLQLKSLDLNQFLKQLRVLYEARSQEEQFVIRFEPPDETHEIQADANQLKGVLINLIENALEAQADELIFGLELRPPFLCIHIDDNGIGMSAETVDKAFGLYYTTKPDGSGLGLPHAQRVVTAHGGYLHMVSVDGKGTKVCILLPYEQGVAS